MAEVSTGATIFQYQGYREVVTMHSGTVRMIECKDGNTVKLYRVEKLLQFGYWTHSVAYTYEDAVKLFDQWK